MHSLFTLKEQILADDNYLHMEIVQHTVSTPYKVGDVHIYSTTFQDEVILFDVGPDTVEAQEWLRNSIDLSRLSNVFITHCHVDHFGGLCFIEQETDATIHLPGCDVMKYLRWQMREEKMHMLFQELGFSGKILDELHTLFRHRGAYPRLPECFSIVEESMPELGISFVNCPGHTQADIVYYTDDWAVTGDTIFSDLFQTPSFDVDMVTGERYKNYHGYCQSLVNLYALREKTFCPAHKGEVRDVDAALLFYVSKILRRAKRIRAYDLSMSVADIISDVFGNTSIDPFHVYLKISEILFLRDFIEEPERLRSSLKKTGLYAEISDKFERALA